tara:strand:+ start:803 stop:1882 length:1080 start_codon:yes stop_codon:yes gene_type:complete
MNKKIIIFSGGTGGHVIPSVNFGNFLLTKGYNCCLVLDKRGNKYSGNFKGKIYVINSMHLSGNLINKIQSLINLLIGFLQSMYIIYKVRPLKCISFGSYATFMPLISILTLKIFTNVKIYLHEQNSIIGKVNSIFIPFSEYLFTNFKDIRNLKKINFTKNIHVGLPDYKESDYDILRFKVLNKKINIFVYGGSQGSVPLINNFLLILKNLDIKYYGKIKVFIQSPKKSFNFLNKLLKNLQIEFEIKEFYTNINQILSITKIAITRAGSGTINDLINYNIPSIIMPLPHSIYNHQYYNAKYLSDINAAILMDQIEFNTDINTKIFQELLTNQEKYLTMKKALEKIIIPNTNEIMLEKILL